MIAVYPLNLSTWQDVYDRTTDADVAAFNAEFGLSYSRKEFAYVAPTISLIDDLLTRYYGRAMSFRTRFLKVLWLEDRIHIEVEVTYKPVVIWN